MKYFKAILVVSLIFIFPAVSYLYLRSGFIFRKDALEELKSEIPFTISQKNSLLKQDSLIFKAPPESVNLFMKISTTKDEKDMYFLAESFKARKDFELTALYENIDLTSFQDTLFSSSINRMMLDTSVGFFENDNRFLLTKDNLIRKTYGTSQDEFNRAYEHTVILLPMKKREKLTLIRDNEK